jgi:hypothetical protein
VPPAETCNGADDDCDGWLDEYDGIDCWREIYRYQNTQGARCLSTSDVSPAPACPGYTYEIAAFVVARFQNAGTYPAVQCSSPSGGPDHIVVEQFGCDYNALIAANYNCSYFLGYVYRPGQSPGAGSPPSNVGQRCKLWRYAYSTAGGGAHLFTRGADNTTGMTCEKSIGNVFSANPCFSSDPPGCPAFPSCY